MLDQQIINDCRGEVIDVHHFFTGWFQGDLPNDDAAWLSLGNRLAPGFQLITPRGEIISRAALLTDLHGRYGQYREAGYPLEVRGFQVRHLGDHHIVATYEEWQGPSDEQTARVSTAIFERDPTQPNHVRWLHVHETWLPDLAP